MRGTDLSDTPEWADGVDWEHTVFALLTPDALARNLGTAILDRLAGLGYTPAGWKVIWRRPDDLDAFHERNINQTWKAYLYRLVDRVFAFGPTVALLLRDDRAAGAGVDSHQRLRRAKGASEPAEAVAGTIRGDFGAINVMLALFHSADTPADSRLESRVFAGTGGFRGLAGAGGDAELRTMLALLESACPPERRDYDAVLTGLRARLAVALWPELTPAGRDLADKLHRANGLAAPGAGAKLADLLGTERHPLEPILRCEFTPDAPTVDIDLAKRVLATYGVELDPWESLVLATSMRFTPRRHLS